jgi:hypothetical protein
LVANASTHLNHSVDVEILESLYGATTQEQLAKLEYGQVEIRIPEGMNGRVSLVPQSFRMNDPNRYRQKFDRVIASPVRVRGEFLSDDEMTKAERRPVYVIRVSAIEPMVLGSPERVPSLDSIKAEPARWDRKYVVYEGTYQRQFEVSALDEMWLETTPNATILNKPASATTSPSSHKVRVTGILFSRPGGHYGHLGGYKFQIIASKIEYLENSR